MSVTEPSDEELMMRVQEGDKTAFEVLFGRHERAVYGFLLRRLDRGLVDDTFQETWLKVHRGRSTWNRGQAVKPWLFGVAANAARDAARRSGRLPVSDDESAGLAAPVGRPEERLNLEAAIARLPDNLREAFLLGPVAGLDHNELAVQLGISPENARARVSRARALLREWVA